MKGKFSLSGKKTKAQRMIEGKEMNMDINQSRGRVKTNEQRLGLMKWNMNLWIKSVESKISSSFFFSGMNREYGIRVLTG